MIKYQVFFIEFILLLLLRAADDFPSDSSTTVYLTMNSFKSGEIETSGDEDWFKISLSSGSFSATLNGNGDPQVYVRGPAPSTSTVASNDDCEGCGLSSRADFTITSSGTYFIIATQLGSGTGTYQIKIGGYVCPTDCGMSCKI